MTGQEQEDVGCLLILLSLTILALALGDVQGAKFFLLMMLYVVLVSKGLGETLFVRFVTWLGTRKEDHEIDM